METNETIEDFLRKMQAKAVIFDLDGTLIDNNAYHLQTWKKYLEKTGRNISEEAYRKNINGRTNKDALEYIYNRRMTNDEAMVFALEKEALYREIYKPFIKPVHGLLVLLEALYKKNIPMAIATSGIQVNIDFMFKHISIKKYFSIIVNAAHISKGKPDPEIYQKTASLLQVPPAHCLVFEDAAVGVQAAKAAGMHVIALTTTQTVEELSQADLIIPDFSALIPNPTP